MQNILDSTASHPKSFAFERHTTSSAKYFAFERHTSKISWMSLAAAVKQKLRALVVQELELRELCGTPVGNTEYGEP
jgi:hypothetical protein